MLCSVALTTVGHTHVEDNRAATQLGLGLVAVVLATVSTTPRVEVIRTGLIVGLVGFACPHWAS
jgi:hypothetical protein